MYHHFRIYLLGVVFAVLFGLSSLLFFAQHLYAQEGPNQNQPPVTARAGTDASVPDGQYNILLRSRQFTPEPGVETTLARSASRMTGRIHVLLQLHAVPNAEDEARLREAGIELLMYIPHNTWYASIPVGTVRAISTSEVFGSSPLAGIVRWVGEIHPQDKAPSRILEGRIGNWAMAEDGRVRLDITFFGDVSLDQAREFVSSFGGVVEGQTTVSNKLSVLVEVSAIPTISTSDSVLWFNHIPSPPVTHNDGVRATANVDIVQTAPYNLSGQGVTIGIWDGGAVDWNHDDFKRTDGTSRVITRTTDVADHATHVAGTMAGNGAAGGSERQWRGVAPNAGVVSYDFFDPLDDYSEAISTFDVVLSQNSWGRRIEETEPYNNCNEYGDYDFGAPDYDYSATGFNEITTGEGYDKGIPIVFSAGNERRDGDCGMSGVSPFLNYRNLPPPGTAKNVITVGAINSDDRSMTDFSSWGPTDDGRVKPEVVAPGCQKSGDGGLSSTIGDRFIDIHNNITFAPGPDDLDDYRFPYDVMCGTSMAAPVVSGISALLIEQYRQTYPGAELWPSTIKALLVHTARDLNDGNSYYNPGPDYASGYGLVDAQAAVDAIRSRQIITSTLGHERVDVYTLRVPADTRSLKFTFAWDDPAAPPSVLRALVNNLDLALVDPTGKVYYPWTLDPAHPSANAVNTKPDDLNPLEQVAVDGIVPAGDWQLRVTGRQIWPGPQAYSLVLSGATVTGQTNVSMPRAGFVDNGIIQLGINEQGHLNVEGGPPSLQGTTAVGLRFLPTGAEATAPGCLCEGWGAADATSGTTGYANVAVDGVVDITVLDFLTGTTASGAGFAYSLVEIGDGVSFQPTLRVSHNYHESITSSLYEATVTIQNISDKTVEPLYRRVMDWDIEPTAFSEFVTIDGGTSTALLFSSDNGFESANPLGSRSSILFTGNAVDSGPEDHGALFDFGFDPLAPGRSVTFNIYYGAASNELDALLAVDAVAAEVYSLGQPNTPDGPTEGKPNTFIFAFSAVGGEPVARMPIRKKADSKRSEPGTENGYTIVATNPTTKTIVLGPLTDTLPVGFTYKTGSTTGVTTADPTISGQVLTWTGPFNISPLNSASLHFRVLVSTTLATGVYYNNASGDAVDGDGKKLDVRATGNAAPVEVPPPTIVSDTGASASSGSVVTDPDTGQIVVSMPLGRRSDVEITSKVTCPDPPGGVPSSVTLLHNGHSYPMTEDPPGSGQYSATIPASDVAKAPMVVEADCSGTVIRNTIGKIELYDPSGIVTDAITGIPIQNATVTLYKVPGWLPDTPSATRDCRTVDTRVGGVWTQPAPTDLGEIADPDLDPAEIDPAVNPQLTNDEGRYGWNVVAGCWYVVVEAAGYETRVSPVVGVPPEVTDLDIELTPTSGTPADCNADSKVDAGDLSALVLEIFDGDGSNPADTPGGSFAGNASCDANQDNTIDAGDLSCTVLTIFNGPGACVASAVRLPAAMPSLSLSPDVAAEAGGRVTLPMRFASGDSGISSLVFSLDYDETRLHLDTSDANGDGIPDAIATHLPAGFSASIAVDGSDTEGEVDVVILDPAMPLAALPDGEILTITFDVLDSATPGTAHVRFDPRLPASFGSRAGQSVPGVTGDGSVLIGIPTGTEFDNRIYLPYTSN